MLLPRPVRNVAAITQTEPCFSSTIQVSRLSLLSLFNFSWISQLLNFSPMSAKDRIQTRTLSCKCSALSLILLCLTFAPLLPSSLPLPLLTGCGSFCSPDLRKSANSFLVFLPSVNTEKKKSVSVHPIKQKKLKRKTNSELKI